MEKGVASSTNMMATIRIMKTFKADSITEFHE